MDYISTRGAADDPAASFTDMVFAGPAPDGGLYMPQTWPEITPEMLRKMRGQPYSVIAASVLAPFCVGEDLTLDELGRLAEDVYGPRSGIFSHPDVAPLRPLGKEMALLELFHGPTLAFKDIALQLVGRVFDHLLSKQNRMITIIGATSGDTGSASIYACAGLKRARIFILHPKDRISEIQRRQMTTVSAANVYNIALEGSFDDCQAAIKALFADHDLSKELNFTAINSINWLRIAAQTVYYVTSALSLGGLERNVSFTVPTGNFGNVFAAYVARLMGAPIGDLVIASNKNDILPRFFATGEMAAGKVEETLSPSMDIQVSSNFERYLFELLRRDARSVNALMTEFRTRNVFRLNAPDFSRARSAFYAYRTDDHETIATIKDAYHKYGIILDPHTAVGVHAARVHLRTHTNASPMVALACAHPAKFPDAIRKAIGQIVPLPPHLTDLMTRTERVTPMRNDLGILKNYIKGLAQ